MDGDFKDFADIPTTTLADVLGRAQVMDIGLRPLWPGMPRVAGPAFTVQCPPGDNLMLHAAIYRAEPGSVIVVESGDLDHALAGGNVCAVAQRRGVAAFVADGLIRDLGEVRELGFPVVARGRRSSWAPTAPRCAAAACWWRPATSWWPTRRVSWWCPPPSGRRPWKRPG